MTLFEFLMAIASVVIAIALTEMFGGWGNLLRTHVRPKVDWLHLGWTILITLYAIQYWVGIWPYRDIEFHSVYQVWFLIFPTLFIVLVAFAITPVVGSDESPDLREYYMSRRGPIFIGMAIFATMAQIADWVILGIPMSAIGVGFILILLIPAITQNIWVHAAVFIFNLWYLTATAGLIPAPYRLLFNPITI